MPSSRKRPAASVAEPIAQQDDLCRDLVQCSTQTGLIQAMTALHTAGGLSGASFKPRQLAKQLTNAKSKHADTCTPYGRVVQSMELPSEKMPTWEYCNPLAFLHVLAGLSVAFFDMMEACVSKAAGAPLRIIIYIDEIVPGNPLRHDKGRTMQAIYWCFAEWPAWVLARTGAWAVFGVLRSSITKNMQGRISCLMRHVVRAFFPKDKRSMRDGIILTCKDGRSLCVKAELGGYLGDEKGLKEIFDCKGQGGTLPCMTCSNVMALTCTDYLEEGTVSISCTERGQFMHHTNASILDLIDELLDVAPGALDVAEQERGFNLNLYGLCLDTELREEGHIQPADQYIRDPMHTLVSNGQANTHTGLLLHWLKSIGITPQQVSEYIECFTLPHKYGKVSGEWLHKNRLNSKDHSEFSSYASTMMSLVPLVYAFLIDVVATSPTVHADHVRCYGLLSSILALVQRVDTAVQNVKHLQELIDQYGKLFIQLYDRSKPKFHHMFAHLHESIIRFQRVLSCFVTERRHRTTKKAALHVFRYLESTVVKDLVNRMCQSFAHDECLFKPLFLLSPKTADIAGSNIFKSVQAVLHCGKLRKGDIVYATTAATLVGRIDRFWELNGRFLVCIESFRRHNNDSRFWSTVAPVVLFIAVNSIVDAVAWSEHDDGIIRIIPPFVE